MQVVDQETGNGVPLVELRTTNDIRYFTDSLGNVAFFEPELMGHEVYFHIQSHGYEFQTDGFGYRGKKLKPIAGEKAVLKITRINLAERMFRVTGAGIYRDSFLLDLPVPVDEPLLNGKVFGSDSVVNAVYHDKLYWFWGDTNRPSYPLGLFHVPGATSDLNSKISPEKAVNLRYFVGDDGFVKAMAQMPGEGPTWISGLTVVKDKSGREQMLAMYVKVRGEMEIYQRGLVGFNDDHDKFEKLLQFELSDPLFPNGHSVLSSDHDLPYAYFATPYPLVRVAANYDSMLDLKQYEAFTYFKDGSRQDQFELDRDGQGKLVLRWRRDTLPMSEKLESELIKTGKIQLEEAYFQLRDVDMGDRVQLSSGSVNWNHFRKKWIMIAVQAFGKPSFLGEVWYSEADSLAGPWLTAKRIVTHDHYSFYNPKQHPYYDQDGGRVIFFEGTYTNMFSANKCPTPRYNYNQIMYRLDLDHPALREVFPR